MSSAELWEKAIATIKAGWVKGDLENDAGHCALGCLGYAKFGPLYSYNDESCAWLAGPKANWSYPEILHDPELNVMVSRLAQVIKEQYPDKYPDKFVLEGNMYLDIVAKFNDASPSVDQVIAVMEKASLNESIEEK